MNSKKTRSLPAALLLLACEMVNGQGLDAMDIGVFAASGLSERVLQ
jgi:hypothetical protein